MIYISVYPPGIIGSLLIIAVYQMIIENRSKVSSFYMTGLATSDLVQNVVKIIQLSLFINRQAGWQKGHNFSKDIKM